MTHWIVVYLINAISFIHIHKRSVKPIVCDMYLVFNYVDMEDKSMNNIDCVHKIKYFL